MARTLPYIPLLLLIICFVSSGTASERPLSSAIPHGWIPSMSHKRSSMGEHEIKVTIALSQRNLKQLEADFWAVSNPSDTNYGRYKSFQEVVDMVAPSQASLDLVTSYLLATGVESSKIELNPSKDFMTVAMTVSQAESIFQTTYEPYVHSKTGGVSMGMSRSFTLNDKINPHIDFVSRFSKLSVPKIVKPATTFSAKPRSKILRAATASSVPIIKLLATDFSVFVELLLVCPDGSASSILGDATFGNSVLGCGATNITSVTLTYVSRITNAVWATDVINISSTFASKCSDLPYNCLPIAQNSNYPADAAYITVYNDINDPSSQFYFPTYVPYVVTAFATYSDNTTSIAVTSTEVENSDLPYPSVVFTQYGVPQNITVRQPNNNQSVVEFYGTLQSSFNYTDLKLYFSGIGIPDYSNLVQVVHPEYNDESTPGEGNQDLQLIMGVARNCTTVIWANNNTESQVEPHLEWIIEVLNQPTSPLVFSVSYAISEQDYTVDYVTRTNVGRSTGITLVYYSGSNGAYQRGDMNFSPAFPSSSPYVTTVGGTQFYSKSNDPSCYKGDNYTCFRDEVVCSLRTGAGVTSGGGFSNIFPRPSYQDRLVSAYLPSIQSLSGYNASNRAYPDVSVIAHILPFIIYGGLYVTEGNSPPIFAGLVTLLNDIRLAGGNAPLGFLNPFIYSLNDSAFKDIVRGDINCTRYVCYPSGFVALPGYDVASGRGSPIFSVWASAVANLPPTNSSSPSSTTSSSSSTSSTTSTNGESIFVLSMIVLLLVFFLN